MSSDRRFKSILDLNGAYGDSNVYWPRSIAINLEKKFDATCSIGSIFIGELIGKIWKINIHLCNSTFNQER